MSVGVQQTFNATGLSTASDCVTALFLPMAQLWGLTDRQDSPYSQALYIPAVPAIWYSVQVPSVEPREQ